MQQKIEKSLERLVAIPSVPSNPVACHEIIAFVRSELAPLNLYESIDTNSDHPWLILTTRDTKSPTTLLAAHLDVVPAPPELFIMQRQDNRLHGRGVYDMKFAAACFIEFAKAHADEIRQRDMGFMFTTDEEIGGSSVVDILTDGWRPGRVFIPDGGEDWQIEARAKGIMGMQLTANGRTAHGSRPWEGDNALQRILDTIADIQRAFPNKDKTDSTLSVNQIIGGEAINQIPAYATALLDFRSFDKDQIDQYQHVITESATLHGVRATAQFTGAPVVFDRSSQQVQDFLAAYRQVRGTEPQYVDSFGGTDARHFAQYGIPTIIVEPRGGGRHAPDEWIRADDLQPYYELLRTWIIS